MKRAADEMEPEEGPSDPPRPWKRAVRGKCVEEGCTTSAFLGIEGDERASRCRKHRLQGMVDIASARCAADGCSKRPSYGVKGTKKATHCATHGEPLGLVNVVSPRCTEVGCETIATYGPNGTTKRTHCAAHGEPLGLVDVTHPCCAAGGCETQAAYGPKGTKEKTHCAVHGKPLGLVDNVNPRCAADGCETQPTFGPEGGDVVRCATHAEPDDVDVRNKRCIGRDGHPCWKIGGRAYYGGRHCYYCADEDELKIDRKKTETRCLDRILGALGALVIHQKQFHVSYKCTDIERTCSYVDAVLDHPRIRVCLEIDERRHAGEAELCRVVRMHNVAEVMRRQSDDARPIAWVRFNPDDGDEPASATDQLRRCGEAVEAIRGLIESPENRIIYINYD